MANLTALYYPGVEPPMTWLRSAALFFDTVASFVPKDSEEKLSSEVRRFADTTNAYVPYAPTNSTALLANASVDKFDQVFAHIAASRNVRPDAFKATIVVGGGSIRVKDHVFMHGLKISPLVQECLRRHGLMLPKEVAEIYKQGDWWLVDERAADLILAHIADRLAARKGWTSITDDEHCYVFTALDEIAPNAGTKESEDALARMLVTELVPDVIDRLSMEEYVELRRRFEPIRQSLAKFMNQVVIDNGFSRIGDPLELRQAIGVFVQDLSKEIWAFRESSVGRTFRKWAPFSLGALLTIAAPLTGQPWALPLAGASVLVGAVDKAGFLERKQSLRSDMVRMVADARMDLLNTTGRILA